MFTHLPNPAVLQKKPRSWASLEWWKQFNADHMRCESWRFAIFLSSDATVATELCKYTSCLFRSSENNNDLSASLRVTTASHTIFHSLSFWKFSNQTELTEAEGHALVLCQEGGSGEGCSSITIPLGLGGILTCWGNTICTSPLFWWHFYTRPDIATEHHRAQAKASPSWQLMVSNLHTTQSTSLGREVWLHSAPCNHKSSNNCTFQVGSGKSAGQAVLFCPFSLQWACPAAVTALSYPRYPVLWGHMEGAEVRSNFGKPVCPSGRRQQQHRFSLFPSEI